MVIPAFWHPQTRNPRNGHSLLILPLRFGLELGLGLQGMSISLGFREWGCPKSGDAHITVDFPKVLRWISYGAGRRTFHTPLAPILPTQKRVGALGPIRVVPKDPWG